jgi:NAD(P)-dependent dehydrogenase (short-subunit alcohol dehydrogenase family)
MAGRVAGRVALVTGASSGLGKRFAQVLAAEGAKVVVAARRKDRLDALVAELGADKALAVECDVTDEAAVVAMFDAAEAKFGVVDTVINNAGMTREMLTQDIAEFRKILDLNVTSVWCVAGGGATAIKAGPDVSRGADREYRLDGRADLSRTCRLITLRRPRVRIFAALAGSGRGMGST